MMLALEIEYNNSNLTEIIADPLNAQLLSALTEFKKTLSLYGYDVQVCSDRSLRKLPELSDDRKLQIYSYFKNWNTWLLDGKDPVPMEDIERVCLQKALNHYGLKADEEFWKTIEKDQIIEIYGDDMVQLYRSLNFFAITGYSLLDISVFEWFILWSRSSRAIEETANELKVLLSEYVPSKKFQIPKQLIREIYDTRMNEETFVPRAILAEFKNMGSLQARFGSDGTPKGFICTSTAEIVALGDESKNIQFI